MRSVGKVGIALAIVLAVPVVAIAISMIASESGEVVVLRTREADGAVHETRLWVVDDEGAAWLRSGSPESSWFLRLSAEPEVEMVRHGATLPMRAVPVPQAQSRINELMLEKYGWADRYIGMLFGRDDAVPVRLDPR
jgi:hypothetical protein